MTPTRRTAPLPASTPERRVAPPSRPQPLDPQWLAAVGGGRSAPAPTLDLPKGTWR